MSGLRKRSPTSDKSQRTSLPRAVRQNPQRWRQAFGFGSLLPGTGSGTAGQGQEKVDVKQNQKLDTSGNPGLYDDLPEPSTSAPTPETGTSVTFATKFNDVSGGAAAIPKRATLLESFTNSPTTQQRPTTTDPPHGELIGKNIIWKSTLSTPSRKPDTEMTFRSATPPPSTIGTGSDRELEDLIGKPVNSADDRYRVLDGLDKIIRKRNPKVKVRVEFAIKLAGTCRDMCPEKERYMREVQRRLSSYECDSSQQDAIVDHQLAIKEYSRSSADQEEPLPHDLRPIQSLNLTFDYLLHNIISRMEDENESLSDLYYFIWDRTRAIRKDMTQQQLGTTEAVLLMEKCARFHIYCSTRLCELDRHSFDPKLNDENLMKCLQSLEHMYADLVPHGIECPNEPEFRAYQILMHLNEGDIVRDIQQKPDRILKSAPVVHALKIYVALNSMNSVAFFRFVEKSSFMVSCILHRYFFQIRTNALRRFIKTFSLKSQISIPTMQVKRMLGFGHGEENLYSFKFFCESHGFASTNIGPASITMRSRNEFEQPEFSLISREHSLIESKLTSSVSEAINGEPLGTNPLEHYIPQSSFDGNGNFKREILDGLNLKAVTTTTPVQATPSPVTSLSGSSKSLTVSPDIRSRLGARVKSSSDPTIQTKPESQPLPRSASTFSFASVLPPPPARPAAFSGISTTTVLGPSSNFTFVRPPLASTPNVGLGSGVFSAISASPPATFNFGTALEQSTERAEKIKAERKQAGVDFGLELAQRIVQDVVVKEAREVAILVRQENVVREAKVALQKTLAAQIYKEVETREIKKMVRIEAMHEFAKAQKVATVCAKIDEDLRLTVVSGLISDIASEVYKQRKAESEARLKHLTEICHRINIRNWIISWKNAATEQKFNRIQELHRQQWNVENFPPILTSQFSTNTILSEWSSGLTPLAEKSIHEKSIFELVERAMDVKRSFKKHVEDFSPSVIHHLVSHLLPKVTSMAPLPALCTQWHPPLTINIVLFSRDFGPFDHLANWTWTSLQQDSVILTDPNFCAYLLPPLHTRSYVTFQKCTNLEDASTDSRALICFHSPRPETIKKKAQTSIFSDVSTLQRVKVFMTNNPSVPVVIFNGSKVTEQEIRRQLFVDSESDSVLSIIELNGHDVVENLPRLVNGLKQIGHGVTIGPPLTPPMILLPLFNFVMQMIRDVFTEKYKGVVCPRHWYEGYNDFVEDIGNLVQNSESLAILKKWPGRASKLVIRQFAKDICFTHEAGMLGVVIKNWKEIERLLKIEPVPVDIINKWHNLHAGESPRSCHREVTDSLREEIAKLTEGHCISDNLRTRFNYVLALPRKKSGILWKEFLQVCQDFTLEKLSKMSSATYQVCVNLSHVQDLQNRKLNLPRCTPCSGIGGRKRAFSMEQDLSTLKCKTICKDSDAQNLLQSMQSLLQEMKEEKEELEASFSELQNSILSDD